MSTRRPCSPGTRTRRWRPAEQARVDRHVRECVACSREVDELRRLQALLRTEEAEPSLAQSRQRTHALLDAGCFAPAASTIRAAVARAARMGARGARPADLLLVLPAVVLFTGRPAERALPCPERALDVTASGDVVVVVFDADRPQREMRGLLQSLAAHIIDGPNAAGAYTLQLPSGQQAEALSVLRSHPGVLLAELRRPDRSGSGDGGRPFGHHSGCAAGAGRLCPADPSASGSRAGCRDRSPASDDAAAEVAGALQPGPRPDPWGISRAPIGTRPCAPPRRLRASMVSALVDDWPMPTLELHCFVVSVPADASAEAVLEQLGRDARVEWAQPMHLYRTLGAQRPLLFAADRGADPAAGRGARHRHRSSRACRGDRQRRRRAAPRPRRSACRRAELRGPRRAARRSAWDRGCRRDRRESATTASASSEWRPMPH